jgi:hypothetical protein
MRAWLYRIKLPLIVASPVAFGEKKNPDVGDQTNG